MAKGQNSQEIAMKKGSKMGGRELRKKKEGKGKESHQMS